MKNRTIIEEITLPVQLSYSSVVLSLGSCFSLEIAARLKILGYDILSNPCGITFNPISIATSIKRAIRPKSLLELPLSYKDELWSHPDLHSSYNHTIKDQLLEKAQKTLSLAQEKLKKVDTVILTVGTAWVFQCQSTGMVVNNCHRRPQSDFQRRLLTTTEIKTALSSVMASISKESEKEVSYILTLSPVRHTRNGLIDDKLSKASCLVAIHELIAEQTHCHYFPSYEIMIDDLRDYRYYKGDLIHPSDQAIQHIYGLFEQSCLRPQEASLRKRIEDINLRQRHKPRFPETAAHQLFTKGLQEDIQRIIKEYPFLADRIF